MRMYTKNIVYFMIFLAVAYFLMIFPLPYYIQGPGGANELDPIVAVENASGSEGDMHLVTVSGMQATPVQYVLALLSPHRDIYPMEEVFPEGVSPDEYMQSQLEVMESSQEAATVVAYQAADEDINIDYNGVYVVNVFDGLPGEGKLQIGDLLVEVDGKRIEQADDLTAYVQSKEANDSITVEFIREGEVHTADITLEEVPLSTNNVAIGISLVTDREVDVNPGINFSSGNIGGPSAGLMFTLEIYDQLLDEDVTKGYEIAGTGQIDYNGNVLPISGIDKKIVSAEREGIDIFFAPNQGGAPNSNYQEAVRQAEEIGSDITIIPVDTFRDALNYLERI